MTPDRPTYDKGLAIRRAVIGDAYVDKALAEADDFSGPLQDLVTEYCWGAVWGPALVALGNVFFIGEQPGSGQTMKLANNLLAATSLAATSEAVVLGVKAGLDPAVMIEVFNAGLAPPMPAATSSRAPSFLARSTTASPPG